MFRGPPQPDQAQNGRGRKIAVGIARLKPSDCPSAVAQTASSTALISSTTHAIQLTTLSPIPLPTSNTNMRLRAALLRSLPVAMPHSTVRVAPTPTQTA